MLVDEIWRLYRCPFRAIFSVVVVTTLVFFWANGGMNWFEWVVGEMGCKKTRHTAPTLARSASEFGNPAQTR